MSTITLPTFTDNENDVRRGVNDLKDAVQEHLRALEDAGASSPSPAFETLTDGATITWDIEGAPVSNAKVTLGGNRTLSMPNRASGSQGVLIVRQDGNGGRTLTLPGGSLQNGGGGTAAALATGPGAITLLGFIYDGTSIYWTLSKGFA